MACLKLTYREKNTSPFLGVWKNPESMVISGEGWYDFGARNYDPQLGMWFNVDPLAEKFSSVSPYNYCYNNPVNFVDPNGKEAFFASHYARADARMSNFSFATGGGGRHSESRSDGGAYYYYNEHTGEYTDRFGNSVAFNEVYNNQIVPNSTFLDPGDLFGYGDGWEVDGVIYGELILRNRELHIITTVIAAPIVTGQSQSSGDGTPLENLEPDYIGGLAPAVGLGNAQLVKAAQFVVSGAMSVALVKYLQENPVFGDPSSWVPSRGEPWTPNNTAPNNKNYFNSGGPDTPNWLQWLMYGVGGFGAGYQLYKKVPRPKEVTPIPSPAPTIIYPTTNPIYGY